MKKDTLTLSDDEKERYHRQMIFPEWNGERQRRLKSSRVFIAGAGGLGSPVSIYLAVAGVGTLRICDNGEPELSNLNRQILHDDSRIGMNKAVSAQKTLVRLNPNLNVEAVPETLCSDTVEKIIGDVDVIVDCLDNFDTRHVINRYAVKKSIPFLHAGVYGMSGQMMFIRTPETPCLWCMHPGSQPKMLFPIVGATAGVIGSLQALEAVKYLSGAGSCFFGRLLVWDGGAMRFEELEQRKMPGCPVCGG